MNDESRPERMSTFATAPLGSTRDRPLRDRVDQPVRPLGCKQAILQQRRLASPSKRRKPLSAEPGVAYVGSERLTFKLRQTAEGLLVERSQRQTSTDCIVQTLLFSEARDFDRWCAAEPSRFETPLLYEQLCRRGHDFLDPR